MAKHDLEKALANVNHNRRGMLKTLLIGTGVAAAAIPLMTSQSMAAGGDGEDPNADGTCNTGLVVRKKTGKCGVAKKKAPDAPAQ